MVSACCLMISSFLLSSPLIFRCWTGRDQDQISDARLILDVTFSNSKRMTETAKKILLVLEETECHDGESFWTHAFTVDEDFVKDPVLDLERLAKGISDGSIHADVMWPRSKGDLSNVYHAVPVTPNVHRVVLVRIPTLQVMIASCFVKKELFPSK